MKIAKIQKEETSPRPKSIFEELRNEADVSAREDQESREKIRVQMVGGENILIFAVDKIIDKTILNNAQVLEVHFSDALGFPENHEHLVLATDLFKRMTENGCFTHVEQHSGWFVLTKPDLDKIQSFKQMLKRETEDTEKADVSDSLASPVIFNDNEAIIEAKGCKCQLPPFRNEHFLCRAVYEYSAGEVVDWSFLYEKMTGYYSAYYGKPQNTRENWRLVYDAMMAVNKRVKQTFNTKNNLFTWQEKTLKRNY